MEEPTAPSPSSIDNRPYVSEETLREMSRSASASEKGGGGGCERGAICVLPSSVTIGASATGARALVRPDAEAAEAAEEAEEAKTETCPTRIDSLSSFV